MKQYIIIAVKYVVMALSLLVVSCSEGMYDYKEFARGGEIYYTGKIDSVKIYSGFERVYVTGLFMSDPKITSCRIYWNNKADSLDVPVIRTEGIDTLKQFIPLPEGVFNFQLNTYDALGNTSIPVNAVGRSYGNDFMTSISNRLISACKMDGDNNLNIDWRNIDKTLGPIATEVVYLDSQGKESRMIVDIEETQTSIPDCHPETTCKYRTLYLPDELCIDTMKTEYQSIPVSYRIDRKDWVVTTNTYQPYDSPTGGPHTYVIDGDVETYWHSRYSDNVVPRPHWLEFDMKQKVRMDMVELVPRQNFAWANFTDFTIQGRNSDDEPWVDYGLFKLEQVSDPQYFPIVSSPQVRYVRLVITNGLTDNSMLAEFVVYGCVVD